MGLGVGSEMEGNGKLWKKIMLFPDKAAPWRKVEAGSLRDSREGGLLSARRRRSSLWEVEEREGRNCYTFAVK